MRNTCLYCEKFVFGHQMCSKHYTQVRRYGKIYRSKFDDNEIVVLDTYAKMFLYSGKGVTKKDNETLISIQDIEKINKFTWSAAKCGNKIYCFSKKAGYLHRLLLKPKNNLEIDHKNGDGLDNRRENLRVCTIKQNRANSEHENKQTGFRGVSIRKNKKSIKYIAFGKGKNGKTKNLGTFDTPEEAHKVYMEHSKKVFKEFAFANRNT